MGLIKSNKQLYWGAGLALVGLVSVFALVRSCADEKEQSEEAAEVAQALKGEDIVLAYVGDKREPVTAYDVDFASKQTLGKLADVVLEGKARFQVAESIIASKSIAQLREAEMSAAELAELEKHVQAHRERLLVKAYLAKHAKPETISEEEMQAYYKENPTKFGARDERKFEMVFVDLVPDRSVHPELLKGLAAIAQSTEWRSTVASRQSEGLPFGYRAGDLDMSGLPSDVRKAAMKLEPKQATNVITQGGKAYLLRVNEIVHHEARPFAEVKAKIAEILGKQSAAGGGGGRVTARPYSDLPNRNFQFTSFKKPPQIGVFCPTTGQRPHHRPHHRIRRLWPARPWSGSTAHSRESGQASKKVRNGGSRSSLPSAAQRFVTAAAHA